nr:unnamed protein product [Callosobruchus analis]
MKKVARFPKGMEKSKPEAYGVQEPTRKTLFDRIKDNFKQLGRVTYLQRVIYIGTHTIPVKVVEENWRKERLTGCLLVYSKHFIHMVEGDEDSIHHHIKELLAVQEENPEKLSNIKFLLEVYNCMRKFYMFVQHFTTDLLNIDIDNMSTTDQRITSLPSRGSSKSAKSPATSAPHVESSLLSVLRGSVIGVKDPYRPYLPEREILQVLLESDFIMTLKDYHKLYTTVPQKNVYKDRVWPVPGDFIPFDVFAAPYDVATELPKPDSTRQKKEASLEEASLEEESVEEEDGGEEETIKD